MKFVELSADCLHVHELRLPFGGQASRYGTSTSRRDRSNRPGAMTRPPRTSVAESSEPRLELFAADAVHRPMDRNANGLLHLRERRVFRRGDLPVAIAKLGHRSGSNHETTRILGEDELIAQPCAELAGAGDTETAAGFCVSRVKSSATWSFSVISRGAFARFMWPLGCNSGCARVERHHSIHSREQPLLAPCRRAGVEQRRAGFEKAEIVRRQDALALIAVLQHLDAVCARDWRAHEVALARCEPGFVCVPPLSDAFRIRPRQTVVGIHINVRVVGIVAGT